MKRRIAVRLTVVPLILAAWVIGLGCWPLVVWSRLNCWTDSIDINSGRVRYQRYLLWACVGESIEETSFSRIAAVDSDRKPAEWHTVCTLSPMMHYSPHYNYHGAIFQIHSFEFLWNQLSFTPEAKRQVVQNVLALWQCHEGYFPVSDYFGEVRSLCDRWPDSAGSIDVKDLPTAESVIERRQAELRAAERQRESEESVSPRESPS